MSNQRSWNVLLSHPAVRYSDVKCRCTEFWMWNVGAWNSSPGGLSYAVQGGPSACARCRDPSPGWHGVRKAILINSIQISPRGHVARSPIRTPSRRSTWHSWTSHPDDSISYPDMLSGSLTSATIRWCVWTPCPDIFLLLAFRICLWQRTSKLRFFMFLSFPLLCHGFQRTLLILGLLWWSKSYQNTKT